MLTIIDTNRLCSASYCKDLLSGCLNKLVSYAAHKVFNEIPERGELQLSVSLVKGSGVSGFARKSRIKECERIIDTEPAQRYSSHETLRSLCRMIGCGAKPTKFILCSALNSCAKTLNWHMGVQIHAQIIQSGHEENLFLSSALVDLYAKCDAIVYARRVFDGIKRHDQVSWTTIISGFSQNGHAREAISMFKEMLGSQTKPNCFTYVAVISACTQLEETFEHGTLLHAHVVKLGFNTNSFVASCIIDCYSKCGRIDQAISLFDETKERDNILLNSMISGYSQNLYGEEALRLFMEMRNDHLSPTNHTLTSILNACGSLTLLQQGRQVHSLVTKMGSEGNVFVISALIDMYAKCGSVDEARLIFDQTVDKNSVLWTSMIMGYAQSGRGSDALELFERLVTEEGFMPDHISFTSILTACNHAGLLDRGIEYFNKMRNYGLVPDPDQYACLVDLYARNGQLRKARELMEEMPYDPNYVMWSSFLSSCKVYGEVELGKDAAKQLFKMEPWNAAPYVVLADIYAKAGLWAEVAKIRKLMKQKGIRKRAGWSWVEGDRSVHIFSVGDATHPESPEIYAELRKLNWEMKQAGYIPRQLY